MFWSAVRSLGRDEDNENDSLNNPKASSWMYVAGDPNDNDVKAGLAAK